MRKSMLALAVAMCAVLAGCSLKYTQEEIRAEHKYRSQFNVDDSIQVAIKNIINKQVECFPRLVFDRRVTVLDEIGEATIEYKSGMSNAATVILVDLKRQNDKTLVTVYATHGKGVFDSIEYGAKGIEGCP